MNFAVDTTPKKTQKLREAVEAVIATLRPFAQSDGGDIEFVDLDDEGLVKVRLHGACVGCPSSEITLTMGIERNLKDKIPEVTGVVCV